MMEGAEMTGFLAALEKQIQQILAQHIRYAATSHDPEAELEDLASTVEIKIIGQRDATAALIKWFTDQLVYQAQGRAKRVTHQRTGDDWLIIRLDMEENISIDRLWARTLTPDDGQPILLTVTKVEATDG